VLAHLPPDRHFNQLSPQTQLNQFITLEQSGRSLSIAHENGSHTSFEFDDGGIAKILDGQLDHLEEYHRQQQLPFGVQNLTVLNLLPLRLLVLPNLQFFSNLNQTVHAALR
jgi:hypothetical protein